MLMDNDTIVTLYREAVDNGDPKGIINSMAKTNGCSPEEIRQILNDAGEFVPRQKRGRPKAAAAEEERARAEETADRVINLISFTAYNGNIILCIIRQYNEFLSVFIHTKNIG